MVTTTTKGATADSSSGGGSSGQQFAEEDVGRSQQHGDDQTKTITASATTAVAGSTYRSDWQQHGYEQRDQQRESNTQSLDDMRSMPASRTPPSKPENDNLDITSHLSTSAVVAAAASPASAHDSNVGELESPAYSLSSTGSSATSRSVSSLSDGDSSSTTDGASTSLTLTPPLEPPVWYDTSNNYGIYNHHNQLRRRPPLVVSAKRLGADVRRQHSKRRRRRPSSRRIGHQHQQLHNQDEWMMDSLAFINPNNESGSKATEENDKEGTIDDIDTDPTNGKRLLLYGNEEGDDVDEFSSGGVLAMPLPADRRQNRNSRSASSRDIDDSSTDDDEESENGEEDYNDHLILFDPNQCSRNEANKKYWEWCYGPVLSKNNTQQKSDNNNNNNNDHQNKVPSSDQSFSASRDPPTKGW